MVSRNGLITTIALGLVMKLLCNRRRRVCVRRYAGMAQESIGAVEIYAGF